MMGALWQGSIESKSASTAGTLLAQGATEYLVLLAVVLIVALVSVALLDFFPGMASDAQITQSQAYWRSATPIAIVESGAKTQVNNPGSTYPYLRIKNNGAYPIRLTGIIGGDGVKITQFRGYGGDCSATDPANISDYYYMAPGEEKYFDLWFGSPCRWFFYMITGASTSYYAGGASSICQNSTTSPGTIDYKTFGFEYIEYIDNQQITKREIGKEFIVKCLPPA
jgi:hypothetical protein